MRVSLMRAIFSDQLQLLCLSIPSPKRLKFPQNNFHLQNELFMSNEKNIYMYIGNDMHDLRIFFFKIQGLSTICEI